MDSTSERQAADVMPPEDKGLLGVLTAPPKSGEVTPYAAKVVAEAFVFLFSIVEFGSTANFGSNSSLGCTSLCRFAIATGAISFVISGIILFGQALIFYKNIERSGFLSPSAEKNCMLFLSFWWLIGVAFLSSLEPSKQDSRVPVYHSSGVGIVFGWLALFASIFAAYKAYHSAKEDKKSLHYAQVMSMRAAEDEEYVNFS